VTAIYFNRFSDPAYVGWAITSTGWVVYQLRSWEI